MLKGVKIGVVGLGYVGLPLAMLFGELYPTVGYDINESRVNDLNDGSDNTLTFDKEQLFNRLNGSEGLFTITSNKDAIADCNVYIITVPTPINEQNFPNLSPLFEASRLVGRVLKKGDFVIYESTVYPGVTEEECVPLLVKESSLQYNTDFFVGYSPERVNPGDTSRTIENIVKITSGSTEYAANFIDSLYQSILKVPTYLAPSIKVAESAKVIENAQRDINIAFVNEVAKIFSYLNIDTHQVLAAAGTKWNFLKFTPGLVGGHCIGVDPFYLAKKAQDVGYYSELILTARRLNDSMADFIAGQVVKLMAQNGVLRPNAKVLLLGLTFKENCPDIRNTKVVDVVRNLEQYNILVDVIDPFAEKESVQREFGIDIYNTYQELESIKYEAIVHCVAHDIFKEHNFSNLLIENGVTYDVKGNFVGDNVTRL